MDLDTIGQISSIAAALIALVGLPMVLLQLRVAQRQRLEAIKLSGSQVLLAVDAVLVAYQEMSRNLRPGGPWHGSNQHPADQELPQVEPYLGVFERLWIAFSIGQIDMRTIDHLYGYRIRNLWANKRIVEAKLQHPELRRGWSMLIALTFALEGGDRLEGHTDEWQPQEWIDWQKRKRGAAHHK